MNYLTTPRAHALLGRMTSIIARAARLQGSSALLVPSLEARGVQEVMGLGRVALEVPHFDNIDFLNLCI
jgi:hypothetical protein